MEFPKILAIVVLRGIDARSAALTRIVSRDAYVPCHEPPDDCRSARFLSRGPHRVRGPRRRRRRFRPGGPLAFGLAAILAFVGTKMLLSGVYELPVLVSLVVILALLAVTGAASVWRSRPRATGITARGAGNVAGPADLTHGA